MRVGVVGLGSMGLRHVKNLVALGCEVIGTDPDIRACQRATEAGAFTAGVTIRVEGLDALVVATPVDYHLEWACEAVRQSLPCFLEKPLGTLKQLPAWRALVQEASGLVTQVGYMCRFHESMKVFRAAAPGKVSTFHVQWDGSKYPEALLESSHEIDLACFLGPQRRLAKAHCDPEGQKWWLEFSDGCQVSINARGGAYYFRQWTVKNPPTFVESEFHAPGGLGQQMYYDELWHFLACVQAGKPTDCPWADGLRVLEVCQRATEMAALCQSSA